MIARGLLVAATVVLVAESVNFPDTCSCVRDIECDSDCAEGQCATRSDSCSSGKTNARCNGFSYDNCPVDPRFGAYTKRMDIWSCNGGSGWVRMYYCDLSCSGIKTGVCNRCKEGYFGENGGVTCTPCPAGKWCSGGEDRGICSAGHYCEMASSSATEEMCPAGYYGRDGGTVSERASSQCSGTCAPGHYCEAGSTTPFQYKCNAGRYGNAAQTTSSCSGSCSAGYYCEEGSSLSTQNECGGVRWYCPAGSGARRDVEDLKDAAYYTTGGTETTRTGIAVCPAGSACIGGEKTECPAGRFSTRGQSVCAGVCEAGSFCPAGSSTGVAHECYPPGQKPEGRGGSYYCEAGTSFPREVSGGYYAVPEGCWKHYNCEGQERADLTVYIVNFGRRMRRVEWTNPCDSSNEGQISFNERVNKQALAEPANSNLLGGELSATDNVGSTEVQSFVLASLSTSENTEDCIRVNPFELVGKNLLVRNEVLNYEACPQYTLHILALTGTGDSATCVLTVDVVNMNDSPYFYPPCPQLPVLCTPGTASYPDDLPVSTAFAVAERAETNIGVGTPFLVQDEDTGQEFTFEIDYTKGDCAGPKENCVFRIGSCSGQLYVQRGGAALDYAKQPQYAIEIRACDDPSFFGLPDTSRSCTPNVPVTVTVVDVNDIPYLAVVESFTPEWGSRAKDFNVAWRKQMVNHYEIDENSVGGAPVTPYCREVTAEGTLGTSIVECARTGGLVDDYDLEMSGDSSTNVMAYSIARNDKDINNAAAFDIITCDRSNNLDDCNGAQAGTLVLATGAILDYELPALTPKRSFLLKISVNDQRMIKDVGSGLESKFDEQEIEVRLRDVNDDPVWPCADTSMTQKCIKSDAMVQNMGYMEETEAGNRVIYVGALDQDRGDFQGLLTYSIVSPRNVFEVPSDSNSALSGNTVPIRARVALDYETVSQYTVTVRVDDPHGGNRSADIIVDVADVNEPPEVLVKSIQVPENATLNEAFAFLCTDPDNRGRTDPTTHQACFFTMTNPSVPFNMGASGILRITDALNHEVDGGKIQFQVQVRDNGSPVKSKIEYLEIIVTDVPEKPRIWGPVKHEVAETERSGGGWQSAVNVVDEDENDTVDLTIESQTTKSNAPTTLFSIGDSQTIVLSQSSIETLDFELEDEYVVVLKATDSTGLVDTFRAEIEVLDRNDSPVMQPKQLTLSKFGIDPVDSKGRLIVRDPGMLVADLQCSDEDRGDTLELTLAESGNVNDAFELSSDGKLRINSNLTKGVWTTELSTSGSVFELNVMCSDGELSDTAIVQVTITEYNFPPIFEGEWGNVQTLQVTENGVPGAKVGTTLQASDSDNNVPLSFSIESTTPPDAYNIFSVVGSEDGVSADLICQVPLDYEDTRWYKSERGSIITLNLKVEDSDLLAKESAFTSIEIEIGDIDEPPTWTTERRANGEERVDPLLQILENEQIGAAVGPSLSGSVYDQEGRELTFTLVTVSSPFALSPQGQLSLISAVDFEAQASYELAVTVSDAVNTPVAATVVVDVLDVNEPPVILSTATGYHANFYVREDEVDGATIGLLSVSMSSIYDPDSDQITFSLADSGFAGGAFEMTSSGLLQVGDSSALDFENIESYDLQFNASDKHLITTGTLRVMVENANDTLVSKIAGPDPPAEMATNGSSHVIFQGLEFGPTQDKFLSTGMDAQIVALLHRGSESVETPCTVLVRNTEVKCEIPEWTGKNLYWELFVNGVSAGTTRQKPGLSKYFAPVISSINGVDSIHTRGQSASNDVITIAGANFGAKGTLVTVRYGSSCGHYICSQGRIDARDCTVTEDHVQIQCMAAAGVGADLRLELLIGAFPVTSSSSEFDNQQSALGSSNMTLSYSKPTLATVNLDNVLMMRTKGGDAVTIIGDNFGTDPSRIVVTYGMYQASDCSVEDHTIIRCTTVRGTGKMLRWVVRVAGQESNLSEQTTDYEPPLILGLSGPGESFASTRGGQIVYITGRNFGPAGESVPIVRYGGYQATRYVADACSVDADNSISCKTVAGTGVGHAWEIEINGQKSPRFGAGHGGYSGSSYAPPATFRYLVGPASIGDVSDVYSFKTTGGDVMVIQGENFGSDSSTIDNVTYMIDGNTLHAKDCIVKSPHVEISCSVPEGGGTKHKWIVSVDGQISLEQTMAYEPPSVTSVTYADGTQVKGDNLLRTDGGQTLSIKGTNLGPSTSYLDLISYGPDGRTFTMNISDCSMVSNTLGLEEIHCVTVPGIGNSHSWLIMIEGQLSTPFDSIVGYKGPSSGNDKISLVSASGEVVTTWPGTDAKSNDNKPAEIYIQGQNFGICDPRTVHKVQFCCDQPHCISPCSATKPFITNEIPILDSKFQGIRNELTTFEALSRSMCSSSTWKPTRRLAFNLPERTGVGRVYKVRVEVSSSEFEEKIYSDWSDVQFEYGAPLINTIGTRPSENNNAEIEIEVTGINFCASEECCQTYVNGFPLPIDSVQHTHTTIQFSNNAIDGRVQIKCKDGSQSMEWGFKMETPFIVKSKSNLDSVVFETSGSQSSIDSETNQCRDGALDSGACVTVVGQYFGENKDELELLVGEVKIGEDEFVFSAEDELLPPAIACVKSEASSNNPQCSSLSFNIPPGSGRFNEIRVFRGRQGSIAIKHYVHYGPPEITSIVYDGSAGTGAETLQDGSEKLPAVISNVPTRGGMRVTMKGKNFGACSNVPACTTPRGIQPLGVNVEVTVGGYVAQGVVVGGKQATVVSNTHTEIVFDLPSGYGLAGKPVIVSLDGQHSSQSLVVEYAEPFIEEIELVGDSNQLASTSGGDLLQVKGANFWNLLEQCSVLVGESLCIITQAGFDKIMCTTPEGEGRDLNVTVRIGNLDGEDYQVTIITGIYHHEKPTLDIPEIPIALPTSGLDVNGSVLQLQLSGNNFGVSDVSLWLTDPADPAQKRFYVASKPQQKRRLKTSNLYDEWGHNLISTSRLANSTGMLYGRNLDLIVVVAGQESNAIKLSFLPPKILSVRRITGNGNVWDTLVEHAEKLPNAFGGNYLKGWDTNACSRDGLLKPTSCFSVNEYFPFVDPRTTTVPPGFASILSSIDADGYLTHSYQLYDVNDALCSGFPLFELNVSGKLNDVGISEGLSCAREYELRTTELTMVINDVKLLDFYRGEGANSGCPCLVENDRSRWMLGAIITKVAPNCGVQDCHDAVFGSIGPVVSYSGTKKGTYFVADGMLFASMPGSSEASKYFYSDQPLACMVNPEQYEAISASTTGCTEWESLRSWRQREIGGVRDERRCASGKRELIEIIGDNFGSDSTYAQVWVVKDGIKLYEAATTTRPGAYGSLYRNNVEGVCSNEDGCVHTHNTLIFHPPPGYGEGLGLLLVVGNQDTKDAIVRFDYDPPEVTSISGVPATRLGSGFLNAALPWKYDECRAVLGNDCREGEVCTKIECPTFPQGKRDMSSTIVLRGDNFGGNTSKVTVLINGKQCDNAKWLRGSLDDEDDGNPFLQCNPRKDVVGPKNAFVCVAGQNAMKKRDFNDLEFLLRGERAGAWLEGADPSLTRFHRQKIRSIAHTQCHLVNGVPTTGRMYELCVPCRTGSDCTVTTYEDVPPADSTFYRFDHDIQSTNAQTRCPRERWDTSLLSEYPDLKFRDTCAAYLKCQPPEACLKDNTCSTGYQWAFQQCTCKRYGASTTGNVSNGEDCSDEGMANTPRPITTAEPNGTKFCPYSKDITTMNGCCVDADPSGASLGIGRHEDCNPNFNGDLDLLYKCSSTNPEHCSRCEVHLDTRTNEVYGECACTQPQRCSLCTMGTHYRLSDECEKCPERPWLTILAIVLLVIGAICAGHILNQKRFNVAFISIGVDYFQVLAMFASSKIVWPDSMRDFFNLLTPVNSLNLKSVFNFNIDIATPECYSPDFEYEEKWFIAETLPLMAIGGLCLIHVGYTVYKLVKQGKKASTTSHVSKLVATFFIIMYYLYLMLTKMALDIFNCNPTDPDDGYKYTAFTSLKCEGGLCRCGEDVQARLEPIAVITLLVYTFGFPASVLVAILKNKELVMEDQFLRAHDLGDERSTNPRAWNIRKRYHKLYYHFKPDKCYWIVLIIVRKFWIAFAGLIFRGNPAFQLAIVLLVLFWAYMCQVQHRPYMSTGEREDVIRDLSAKAKKAAENPKFQIYLEIKHQVEKATAKSAKQTRKIGEKMFQKDISRSNSDETSFRRLMAQQDTRMHQAQKYFFDYNTVEQMLLGAAILVCLAGLMFESGRFEGRPDLEGQRDVITYCTFLVIALSLVFYFSVFVAEFAPQCKIIFKWFAKKRSHADRDKHDMENNPKLEGDLSNLKMSANPMNDPSQSKAVYANKEAKLAAEAQQAKKELLRVSSQMDVMKAEINRLKKEKQQESIGSARGLLPSVPSFRKKKQFSQMSSGHEQVKRGASDRGTLKISAGGDFAHPNPMRNSTRRPKSTMIGDTVEVDMIVSPRMDDLDYFSAQPPSRSPPKPGSAQAKHDSL